MLLLLFTIPLLAAAIAFFLPANWKRLPFLFSLIPLMILIYHHSNWIGEEFKKGWLPSLSISFHLGVDSLSLVFLYLTAIIIPISLLAMHGNTPFPNIFCGLVLLLQGLLIGLFTARDLVVFTIFWEAILLPLFFIINLWGGTERQSAALKFLIYMVAGSTLMIAAVLALYFAANTFDLDALAKTAEDAPYAAWICAIFLLAFAVKTPLFPFHAWLPDTYCEAPAAGTILLAGLLSKAGIYGILRITMEFFPSFLKDWSPFLLGLAIAGVFYGGLAAWKQADFKRLLAYSSLSHVNFILTGLFIWNLTAYEGAVLQAINHGLTITALFLVAGWLEERLGSTAIGTSSGLANFFPHLCWLTLFFVLSAIALPGTNNFIGEFMILFGLFGEHPWLTAVLGLTVILSVIYMLRWMESMYFGTPRFSKQTNADIKVKEILIALPLVFLILWIGIYPKHILKPVGDSSAKMEISR